MFSPLHNELNDAIGELRARQEQLATAFGKVGEVAASATTKDRLVRATVDGQGRLTELAFKGQRWREMAPKELCAKIVEVVADAQGKAAASVQELMTGLIPDGVDLGRLRETGPDLDAMIDSAIADAGRWSR
ncbi:YbaB/EbfC family nucleoid-associated protein [Actinophytocola glycyrrhizae]|uniref:YbaB/EbfC family nucleoid-associated protein n=1 Tax=Actinophytocola glycyrrhizae TaxID=2044873 RepID=A0ABV9RWG4_9PSEU